jgi:hypothetical protein
VSTWSRLRAALRREKRDLDEAVQQLQSRLEATLDQRQRDLDASASDKLAMEQDRARAIDDQFEAIRRRIGDQD